MEVFDEQIVHHKNGNICDNRKSNLQVMSLGQHSRFHQENPSPEVEIRRELKTEITTRKRELKIACSTLEEQMTEQPKPDQKEVHIRIDRLIAREARVIGAHVGCSVADLFRVSYMEHVFHVGVRGVLEILSVRAPDVLIEIDSKQYELKKLLIDIAQQLPIRKPILIKED